jgi:cytoskeleton protein RodZ
MSDKNQVDEKIEDSEIKEPEHQNKTGLGDYLKSEREKKGIGFDEMAELIRIRKSFLEALENEEWDDLPSPVFVKGFIRSYTQALGLERQRAIELYEKNTLSKDEPPRPLVEPKRKGKMIILYPVIFLGIIGLLLYLWITPEPEIVVSEKTDTPVAESKKVSDLDQKESKKVPDSEQPESKKITELKRDEPESEKIAELKQDEPKSEKIAELKQDEPEETLSAEEDTENDDTESGSVTEENEETADVNESQTQPVLLSSDDSTAVEQDEPDHLLVLMGIINMETYIKIYIDDNLPKEYIFKPGSRPRWEAKEGFNILVGNAAGVEFIFNGEKIENLGAPGKVLRIRLPEGFEPSVFED